MVLAAQDFSCAHMHDAAGVLYQDFMKCFTRHSRGIRLRNPLVGDTLVLSQQLLHEAVKDPGMLAMAPQAERVYSAVKHMHGLLYNCTQAQRAAWLGPAHAELMPALVTLCTWLHGEALRSNPTYQAMWDQLRDPASIREHFDPADSVAVALGAYPMAGVRQR